MSTPHRAEAAAGKSSQHAGCAPARDGRAANSRRSACPDARPWPTAWRHACPNNCDGRLKWTKPPPDHVAGDGGDTNRSQHATAELPPKSARPYEQTFDDGYVPLASECVAQAESWRSRPARAERLTAPVSRNGACSGLMAERNIYPPPGQRLAIAQPTIGNKSHGHYTGARSPPCPAGRFRSGGFPDWASHRLGGLPWVNALRQVDMG